MRRSRARPAAQAADQRSPPVATSSVERRSSCGGIRSPAHGNAVTEGYVDQTFDEPGELSAQSLAAARATRAELRDAGGGTATESYRRLTLERALRMLA